ncbi:hypothetical protein TWF694_009530 [Orbilia ellipsospora]|uniref:DUF7029 domain-containing protein n=1 Tax=Orbilia ellipsospora TaxID=2528407 RepID=A0AAV9XB41_9PEZI
MVNLRVISFAIGSVLFGLEAQAGVIRASTPEKIDGEVNLLPLRERDLYPHMQKRSDDYTAMDLQSSIKMRYLGMDQQKGGRGAYYAEVDLHQPHEDHPIVLLENFDHLTKKISCTGDKMSLKFNDGSALEHIEKSWGWVNRDEVSHFYMVAHHHHQGCAADEERTPYKIMSIDYDRKSATASLIRQPVTWKEAAQDFDLKIGTISHQPNTKRGLSIYNKNDAYWALFNYLARETPVEIPVHLNPEPFQHTWNKDLKQKVLYEHKPGPHSFKLNVTCEKCYLELKLDFEATITHRRNNVMQVAAKVVTSAKGRIDMHVDGDIPVDKDYNALDQFIDYYLKKAKISGFIKLDPRTLPGFGVTVGGGLTTKFNMGFEFDTGKIELDADLSFDLDTRNLNISRKGFRELKPQIKNLSGLEKLDVTLHANPYLRISIGLGIILFDSPGVPGAGLATSKSFGALWGLQLTQNNTVTPKMHPKPGFCKEKGRGTFGLKWVPSFTITGGYKVFNDISLFGFNDLIKPKNEWKDLMKPKPLAEICHIWEESTKDLSSSKPYSGENQLRKNEKWADKDRLQIIEYNANNEAVRVWNTRDTIDSASGLVVPDKRELMDPNVFNDARRRNGEEILKTLIGYDPKKKVPEYLPPCYKEKLTDEDGKPFYTYDEKTHCKWCNSKDKNAPKNLICVGTTKSGKGGSGPKPQSDGFEFENSLEDFRKQAPFV